MEAAVDRIRARAHDLELAAARQREIAETGDPDAARAAEIFTICELVLREVAEAIEAAA